MSVDMLDLVFQANPIVQLVLILLVLCSFVSWGIIALKSRELKRADDDQTFWTRSGVGFNNQDASINLLLNALPIGDKVQVRDYEEKAEQAEQG